MGKREERSRRGKERRLGAMVKEVGGEFLTWMKVGSRRKMWPWGHILKEEVE